MLVCASISASATGKERVPVQLLVTRGKGTPGLRPTQYSTGPSVDKRSQCPEKGGVQSGAPFREIT